MTYSDPISSDEGGTPAARGASSASKKKTAKKASTKKTTTKKATAKKTTTKKAPTKKTTTKKAPAKKTTTKKAPAKKTTTKKVAAKKTTTKKAAANKAPAKKKTTAKKAAANKAPAKKKTTAKKAAANKVVDEVAEDRLEATNPTAENVDESLSEEATASEGSESESESGNEENAEPRKRRRRRRGGRNRRDASDGEGNQEESSGTADDAGDAGSSDAADDDAAEGDAESAPQTSAEDDSTDAAPKKKARSRREWKRPDRAAIEITPTGPRAPLGSRLMLIDEVPGESCRIAVLENGRLEELFVERAQSSTAVGNIYKARVVNVERSIQAAFVDYGEGMNGFLHVSDLHPRYFPGGDKTEKVGRKTPRRDRPPIEDALKKGQEILVQVLKQGVGTKGPTVTSYLSIPGRLMVMMPGMDRVGVSRKVDDEQRDRMRKILDQLELPEGFGFILRTAGYDKTKAELKRDVSYLKRIWNQLEKRMDGVGAPSELYTEGDLIVRTIRDVVDDSVGSIVINSDSGFERASTYLDVIAPKSSPTVRHYADPVPLFDTFGVESQIELIHAREVPLKSGGALVIDQTEAMVAIDVNSGRSRGAKDAEANAVSTNREAVDEIARQLRLRDQGGLVVCDLIDMRFARNRKELEERLADNLGRDRARTTFLPISEFGLVEMTRQRIRPSIRSQYFSPCNTCSGLGEIRNADSVAADAVRRSARLLANEKIARVELVCGARIASALLAAHRRRIDALERSSGGQVDIRISDQIPGDRFDVYAYDDRNADLDLSRLPRLTMPDVESLPVEILEPDTETDGDQAVSEGGGGRRRRRRRRKPAPADVLAIALAGGFDDEDEEGDDEILDGTNEEITDGDSDGETEGGTEGGTGTEEEGGDGRKRRRRRRRRRGRGRGGEGEGDGVAEALPVPTEPIRVHALAKELGIKSRDILDAVAEKLEDLELKGYQSSIPAERILEVRSFFSPPAEESQTVSEVSDTDTDAGAAETDTEVESGPHDSDATDDVDENGVPRKKRRRRRRGGRRRRGRGGDGEGDGEGGGEGGEGRGNGEGQEDGEAEGRRPQASRDHRERTENTPRPESTPVKTEPKKDERPKVAVVETETPVVPKPRVRRSLYGGRFQRVGSTPPSTGDRGAR